MPSDYLTPAAYGVLQGLDGLGMIRLYEPDVEKELTKLHLAEKKKGRLVITEQGRETAQEMRDREIRRIRNKKPRYLA